MQAVVRFLHANGDLSRKFYTKLVLDYGKNVMSKRHV